MLQEVFFRSGASESKVKVGKSKRFLGLCIGAMTLMASTSSYAARDTFVYCSEGNPTGFEQAINVSGTTSDAAVRLFDGLFTFKLGSTEVVPALAKSYTVSPNGLIYTIHLRKGVKFVGQGLPKSELKAGEKPFVPTRDFNADDVVFSFRRQDIKPSYLKEKDQVTEDAIAYNKAFKGAFEYYHDMDLAKLIKSVSKVNDYTVRFVLNKKSAVFIPDLAMDFAQIVSQQYAHYLIQRGTPKLAEEYPVGTGRYILKHFIPGSRIIYVRNDQYWGQKAKIKNLIFDITPNPENRLAKMKTGECNAMAYPLPTQMDSIKKDPRLQVVSAPSVTIGFLGYNVKKKPLTDPRVREALSLAVDRQRIINLVYKGAGELANVVIPPTVWSYDKKIPTIPYNVKKAKELLAKAGYPHGFSIKLWAMPVQRPYMPDAKRTAVLIQNDWAKIGVKAQIVTYDWAEYLNRLKNGEGEAFLSGWISDNGDPDNFFSVLLGCSAVGGNNYAQYCNKKLDKILTEAQQSSHHSQRVELYKKAQKIVRKDLPWLPLAYAKDLVVLSKNVKGYVIDPIGRHYFYDVSFK